MSIRLVIADDSVVFRRIVSDALSKLPEVEIVGTATNGREAVARAVALHPDLMTLDIEMPELNGIEVLEQVRAQGMNTGVIALSALTTRGGELTMRALELGAFDFVTKPEGRTPQESVTLLCNDLVPLVQAFAARRKPPAAQPQASPPAKAAPSPRIRAAAPVRTPLCSSPLVLIGVSTGGPKALASLIPSLPAGLNAPVLIVQHMPPLFTQPLAASLAAKSALPVREASDGEPARAGHVYIAPGGNHMKLARTPAGEVLIRITSDPPENNCRPAVDYLFRSAALQFPGRAIAVILTGMGRDGTLGLRLLKRGGCVSIAQDEATSVVFGMPKEAIQAGVVDSVVPLDKIAEAITRAVDEARA